VRAGNAAKEVIDSDVQHQREMESFKELICHAKRSLTADLSMEWLNIGRVTIDG
jgi:hypothetical protein